MVDKTRAALLLAVSCVLPLLTLPASAEAQRDTGGKPDCASQILWLDASNEKAVFIPAVVLAQTALDELPLSRTDRDILESDISRFQNNERGYCDRPQDRLEQGTSPEAVTFESLLNEAPVVFEGTIHEIVDGWSPWTNDISQVAYIRVDEVIKGSEIPDGPSQGQSIGVLFKGGRVVIADIVLCADPIRELYSPRIQERVLISGTPWSGDARFFNAAARFPIVGDGVVAQPYSTLRADQAHISLSDIKGALKKDQRKVEGEQ
jgi:hypothetical protein